MINWWISPQRESFLRQKLLYRWQPSRKRTSASLALQDSSYKVNRGHSRAGCWRWWRQWRRQRRTGCCWCRSRKSGDSKLPSSCSCSWPRTAPGCMPLLPRSFAYLHHTNTSISINHRRSSWETWGICSCPQILEKNIFGGKISHLNSGIC